jgi:Fe-S-cluster containining protein
VGAPYYQKTGGLRFECTKCGNCCTRPGPVYLPPLDLARAASHLGMSGTRFRRTFGVRRLDGVEAVDPGAGAPCPFYDEEEGCRIYPARPTQCRTWPFWPEVVRRKRSWERAARDCEGMNQGPRVSPVEIEQALFLCESVELPEGEPF